MAKWRLTAKSLIAERGNHGVVYDIDTVIGDEPGVTATFTGEPGPHMEPLNDSASAKTKAAMERYRRENLAWIDPNSVMNTLSLDPKPKTMDLAEVVGQQTQILSMLAEKLVGGIAVAGPPARGRGRPPGAKNQASADARSAPPVAAEPEAA